MDYSKTSPQSPKSLESLNDEAPRLIDGSTIADYAPPINLPPKIKFPNVVLTPFKLLKDIDPRLHPDLISTPLFWYHQFVTDKVYSHWYIRKLAQLRSEVAHKRFIAHSFGDRKSPFKSSSNFGLKTITRVSGILASKFERGSSPNKGLSINDLFTSEVSDKKDKPPVKSDVKIDQFHGVSASMEMRHHKRSSKKHPGTMRGVGVGYSKTLHPMAESTEELAKDSLLLHVKVSDGVVSLALVPPLQEKSIDPSDMPHSNITIRPQQIESLSRLECLLPFPLNLKTKLGELSDLNKTEISLSNYSLIGDVYLEAIDLISSKLKNLCYNINNESNSNVSTTSSGASRARIFLSPSTKESDTSNSNSSAKKKRVPKKKSLDLLRILKELGKKNYRIRHLAKRLEQKGGFHHSPTISETTNSHPATPACNTNLAQLPCSESVRRNLFETLQSESIGLKQAAVGTSQDVKNLLLESKSSSSSSEVIPEEEETLSRQLTYSDEFELSTLVKTVLNVQPSPSKEVKPEEKSPSSSSSIEVIPEEEQFQSRAQTPIASLEHEFYTPRRATLTRQSSSSSIEVIPEEEQFQSGAQTSIASLEHEFYTPRRATLTRQSSSSSIEVIPEEEQFQSEAQTPIASLEHEFYTPRRATLTRQSSSSSIDVIPEEEYSPSPSRAIISMSPRDEVRRTMESVQSLLTDIEHSMNNIDSNVEEIRSAVTESIVQVLFKQKDIPWSTNGYCSRAISAGSWTPPYEQTPDASSETEVNLSNQMNTSTEQN